jgi:hypothetical protein
MVVLSRVIIASLLVRLYVLCDASWIQDAGRRIDAYKSPEPDESDSGLLFRFDSE